MESFGIVISYVLHLCPSICDSQTWRSLTLYVCTCVGLHTGIFVRGVGGGTMSYNGGHGTCPTKIMTFEIIIKIMNVTNESFKTFIRDYRGGTNFFGPPFNNNKTHFSLH